ncbi:fibronectin type III domain-containing protein [Actinomadura scrupuli]|uniref:fibronectin type III domain-containing protein n=1 Tax=Actinomadura scrupuli TaxID=559629 RepID=UPI003D98ED5B
MGRVGAAEFERMTMAERHELLRYGLTRRGFLRTAAVGAATLAAGPTLLTRTAAAAAPVTGRWLAMGADPLRQMRVSWQVAAAVARPRVRLGTDTGYGTVVEAELTPLRARLPDGSVHDQFYVRADLEGLRPGTTYHYRVEHDGLEGADATFATAPAGGSAAPFTFTAFGDQGVSEAATAVTAAVVRERPAFHLLAGDISYAETDGKGLLAQAYKPGRWDRYFQQIDAAASTVPWMVASGNHEMEPVYDGHGYGGLRRRFALPGNGPPQCPAVYTFRYSNVGVVSLDANDVTYELATNRGYSEGAQTEWLRRALAGLRADPEVDFIVVFFHQCAYASCVGHGSDAGVRAAWTALFDEYTVDLVVNGHNHSYERTDPLRAGAPVTSAASGSTVWPAVHGTTYVVAGGGGIALDGFRPGGTATLWSEPGRPTKEQVTWSRARYPGFSYLSVRVRPGDGRSTMTVRARRPDGSALDTVTLARANTRRARASAAGSASAAGAAGAGVSGTALAVAGTAAAVTVAAGTGAYLAHRRRPDTEPS